MNNRILFIVGRALLSLIFIVAGVSKLFGVSGTMGYMQAMGVPGILIWPTIALEIGGGIALLVGFQTKYTAWALAAFSVIAGIIFHSNFADQMQQVLFMKNLAIAGGLLILSVSAWVAKDHS